MNSLLAKAGQQIEGVMHEVGMVIGRQYAGENRQTMVLNQGLGGGDDPAHNPGQDDQAIDKPSTICASLETVGRKEGRKIFIWQSIHID